MNNYITFKSDEDQINIAILIDLTIGNVFRIKSLLENRIPEIDKDVVIDLGKVNKIDSSGLALLISIRTSLNRKNLLISLDNMHQDIFDTLKYTKLTKLFNIRSMV